METRLLTLNYSENKLALLFDCTPGILRCLATELVRQTQILHSYGVNAGLHGSVSVSRAVLPHTGNVWTVTSLKKKKRDRKLVSHFGALKAACLFVRQLLYRLLLTPRIEVIEMQALQQQENTSWLINSVIINARSWKILTQLWLF